MSVEVWVPDRPQRSLIGELPAGVRLRIIPRSCVVAVGLERVEFLVPPYGVSPVLELIPGMPRLRVIQAVSAGVEWLLPWVPDGVTLCNARGARDLAVAEWVLGAILAMEKRLFEFDRRRTAQRWEPELLDEVAGKRALVIGAGALGTLIASRLTGLEVEVTSVARSERPGVVPIDALPDLLRRADIVVLAVPLTAESEHLLDGQALALMRTGALVVNVSRGRVLDTEALVAELESGRLRAALDVTDPEPLEPGHPLWRTPGTLVTPHLAGDSPQSEARVYRMIGDQIRRHLAGEPLLNVVDR